MTELKFAAIRAHGLYRTLRLDSKDGPIRSKEPFKALCAGPPEAHERVLLYRGIPGGQYLAVFVGCNLRLWDIAKGKCLGELEFEAELALWEMHVVKSDPGNETLILVVHESPWDPLTFDGSIPSGGHIAIYTLALVPAPRWGPAPFIRKHSFPMPLAVTSILIDRRFMAIACQSSSSNICLILMDLSCEDSLTIQSDVVKPKNSALPLFKTATELILYYEQEASSYAILYTIDHLTDMLDKATDSENGGEVHMKPEIRMSSFSDTTSPTHFNYWDTFIWQCSNGLGFQNSKSIPVLLTISEDHPTQTTHLICHVLDPSFGQNGVRRTLRYKIHHKSTAVFDGTANTKIWVVAPGYAAYVAKSGRKPLSLKLIVFPLRDENDKEIVERTIHLPSFIDLRAVSKVDFDEACGRLFLVMLDSTIHVVDLV